jgi:CheY-like chemotaxis protein
MNEHDKLRVLIAEDEESFLGMLTSVLEQTNRFIVYPCESGEEAVEAMKRARYDVVILDYRMPGMTGLNVLQWMHEQKLDTPAIVLTGAGSENIAVESLKLGAYDYIRKDHFDRDHFPILAHGVYERYLFKKEKSQRDTRSEELAKELVSLESLKTSLAALAWITDSTQKKISSLTQNGDRLLTVTVNSEARQHLEHLFQDIRIECETFSTASTAMINLSAELSERIAGLKKTRHVEKQAGISSSVRQERSEPKP